MRTLLLIVMLVCAHLCGCAGGASRSSDRAHIQGVWLAETESLNGHRRDVAYEYDFRGDRVTFKDETGQETTYSFKLGTANAPRIMTLWTEETLADAQRVRVAYELDGDSLTIVIAPPGLRPTEISDKNNQELIVCKRRAPSAS